MSTHKHLLEINALQQDTQRGWYRAGLINLDEQFEPWVGYLQQAIQTAALYGVRIDATEAEAAIECLFEINPQACRSCENTAPAGSCYAATLRQRIMRL